MQQTTRNILGQIGLVGVALWTGWQLQLEAAVAVLELERSTDAKTWQKVALDPTLLTTGGGLRQPADAPNTFYRLKINDDAHAGSVIALPLSEAPADAVAIAEQFLRDFSLEDPEGGEGDPEGSWGNVRLGPICYPVYDPALDAGNTPAYLEFKIVRALTAPTVPSAKDPFGMSPPDTVADDTDFGYLLVSLTPDDVPVPSFAQSGATPVERLLQTARTPGPIKPLRFDDGLLIAEDLQGTVVASIGNEPALMDPGVLTIAGKEFEGADTEQGTKDDEGPKFPSRAYASYREFKADYLQNPTYVELRRLRARAAAEEWDAVLGREPETIRVRLSQREVILPDRRIREATVADPQIAVVNLPSTQTGLWVTGAQAGGTVLHVTYVDGATERFLLEVTAGRLAGPTLHGIGSWTAWKYWYAGNWSDQRRYKQFSNDPEMCPGGASGCGPAAWAMLYGWWDRKGSPRLMKSTSQADAPLQNDDSVRDCNRYVFDQVGPFCVNGQAATMPWLMKLGAKWAQHRNAGRDITWNWGLPYASPGSVSKAASSVKAGRPAILGLGYYWHYVLAYGYKAREYKTGSITWKTQRYFKCNMGWGGSSAEWRNASSVWFGTHARYW